MLEVFDTVLVVLDEHDLMECVFASEDERAAERMARQLDGRVVRMDVFTERDPE